MKTKLSIVKVEPKNKISHPPVPYEILPQHEFAMLIVAPKGSGKTNFICNLLLNHYKGYFHDIWVCSPTINNDDKWDVVKSTRHVLKENRPLENLLRHGKPKKGKVNLPKVLYKNDSAIDKEREKKHERFSGQMTDDNFFTNLETVIERVDEQHAMIQALSDKYGLGTKAKFVANRILVVIDDQAGMFQQGHSDNRMVNFVIRHRHTSTSVIIVTQAYKAIPRTIRTQCDSLIIFNIPNLTELKVIYEENPETLNEKEWMKVYKIATEGDYNFLYINNRMPRGHTLFKNFESALLVEDKED